MNGQLRDTATSNPSKPAAESSAAAPFLSRQTAIYSTRASIGPMSELGQTEKNSVRAYVFRSSASSGHPGRCRGELSVLLESQLLSLIQPGFEPGRVWFQVVLWCFTFLNYTKSTKYEALEKNAVSRRQLA